MSFIAPNFIDGALIWGVIYLLPVIIAVVIILLGIGKESRKLVWGGIIFIICMFCISSFVWFETMEVPSVDETVVTVQEWQPSPNVKYDENGRMVIDNANQLILITSDGDGFQNTEHLWFGKFDTRDILNHMKPGGTYKIRYYGWRNGVTSSFPNILSIEEVVDESHVDVTNSYFGTRIVA